MTIPTPALHAEHPLDQLAGQFAHWRQTRTHLSARIPPALWEHAVALAAVLPPARVATQLRLRVTDLKKQLAARQPSPVSTAEPPAAVGFVEVPPVPVQPPRSTPAAATIQLELSRADGTRLALYAPAALLSLDMVVRAFVEGRACCN